MEAQQGGCGCVILQLVLLILLISLCKSQCVKDTEVYIPEKIKCNAMAPDMMPSSDPQPFLPLLAPSPLTPFTNSGLPKLSGLCTLNFSAAENIMSIASTNCWASFAPYLANVVCCPQFDATLVILLGQYSKLVGLLKLDTTNAKHCLSDFELILESQGANQHLRKICSIHPVNLTARSCPVVNVKDFERIVDSSRLLAACEKVDPVKECCHQVCQNAIMDAARKLATGGNLPENSTRVKDCKSIVFRWLASKLDASSANGVLRALSNCKMNKVCPLSFPDMKNVTEKCGNTISNQLACCKAMDGYVAHLQEQSFITNLQALNCAASLGMKLQESNVSRNVYGLCHISLKDFSVQVGSQESGCLLPSLPSDVTFDKSSGIGFICDLNDNIEAPWPSNSSAPTDSCNQTAKIPALPQAASSSHSHSGFYIKKFFLCLVLGSSLVLSLLN